MTTESASPRRAATPASNGDLADLSGIIARVLPTARTDSHRLLVETGRIRTLVADEIIFWQGEPVPFTVVMQGHAALRRTTPDGRQLVLRLATRGNLVGYTSITGLRASVDLVAVTGAKVAVWPSNRLRSLAAGDEGLALDVIDGMSRYAVEITERLDGFIHQDARRRVVRILARYGDLFFDEPPVLSRAHLPSLVGTSREMTGRVIRELEREETIIRVGRTGLRLLSPARLQEAAALNAEEAD